MASKDNEDENECPDCKLREALESIDGEPYDVVEACAHAAREVVRAHSIATGDESVSSWDGAFGWDKEAVRADVKVVLAGQQLKDRLVEEEEALFVSTVLAISSALMPPCRCGCRRIAHVRVVGSPTLRGCTTCGQCDGFYEDC